MKKRITIEFDSSWVLQHRDDDLLPVSALEGDLAACGLFEREDSSLTSLCMLFDAEALDAGQAEGKVREIFSARYPQEDAAQVLSVQVEDVSEEELKAAPEEQEEAAREEAPAQETPSSAMKQNNDRSTDVLAQIEALVGAAEFKALAGEIAQIAEEIRRAGTYEVFANQCYLFSIGDGCGLTTYLTLLAQLIERSGLCKLHSRAVREERLGAYREGLEPFEDVIHVLGTGDKKQVRVLCVDISEWMNKTDNRYFKQFLRMVEKHAAEFIVVFRVPFVDKDILSRISFSLNDLLTVKTVSFPPLNRNEIRGCAELELKRFNFNMTKTAWEFFYERISEEKSDGKFYGVNTVKKVVKELIYHRQLRSARTKKPCNVIGRNDTRALCSSAAVSDLSGREQLARLVGSEEVKKRIDEIVAQIELSLKSSSAERPCIHMRFVGNPGTGKTTVARIIGRILKEKGVLRVGNFYEYAGRDFCGRYVGETAPKTASICRDAYGSVLFIDEAYSLYRGEGSDYDYGREAIDTLIAEMENHRSDFVVIMAGYTDDMNRLMDGNAGLASRMPYTIEFPNFTREQLYDIFVSMVNGRFRSDEQLFDAARAYFTGLPDEMLAAKEFSNARFVRNLFERTWAKAAMRSQLDGKAEVVLTKEDFEHASADKEFTLNVPKKMRLGFIF